MSSRRQFIQTAACSGAALFATGALAQAPAPILDEKDPQAVALGYVVDTTKANKAKYPNHVPSQMCGNCQFFAGKPTDPLAPCPLFANKRVHNKGWCSAWAKKAA